MQMNERNIRAVTERIDSWLLLAKRIARHNDPDTIHDFRVASRHLLAIAPLITEKPDSHWTAKVKKYLKALNRLRDLQVLRERLGEAGKTSALLLDEAISAALNQWQKTRLHGVPGNLNAELRHDLHQALQRFGNSSAGFVDVVQRLCNSHCNRVLERLAVADTSRPETLHRLRIAYKSFRYLITFLHDAGVLPEADREALKHWQDLLGRIQDDEVALEWLQQHIPNQKEWIERVSRESETHKQQFVLEREALRMLVAKQLPLIGNLVVPARETE